MAKNPHLLKIIIAGVVILAAVLILVLAVGGGQETDDDGGNQAAQPQPWRSNSEVERALLGLGFVCDRQTYSNLSFGDDQTEAVLVEKMATAGIADAELELCGNEATGVTFGSGLPEDIDALHGVYSDFRCESGQDDFLGLSDGTTAFLVDGIYYVSNQDSDTDALRGILDGLGIDYDENEVSLKDCGS